MYELTTIEKLIDDLKIYNNKIKISLKEVLFDDGIEDQVMTIKKVIDHIKRLDKNTSIMVLKSFWENPAGIKNLNVPSRLEKKWPISLEIIKVIERSCRNRKKISYDDIVNPEDNIEDVPNFIGFPIAEDEILIDMKYLINKIGINQSKLAKILSISDRTVTRWKAKPEQMPKSVLLFLRAWYELQRNRIDWKP